MTINEGRIDIGTGLVIEPGLTESKFLNSSVGKTATVFVKNGVYCSYKLQDTNIDGKIFLPVLYFSDGELVEVHLYVETIAGKSWATYSSQSEMAQKLKNDNWLQKVLGLTPPYIFSWGKIESVIDQKGGMAFILLRYLKV